MQTQPELIAYHYGEAGAGMTAARWWGRAAWRALECCANREALQHVRRGLDALAALPAGRDARAEVEMRLRLLEGAPLVALHGWAFRKWPLHAKAPTGGQSAAVAASVAALRGAAT